MPGSSDEIYPVAIIGGGPVGLCSSILLSLRGIPHVLFERRPSTSIHPKACGINQRTTEIFRKLGIEEDVYAVAGPPEVTSRTAWYTSLGPEGKEIASRYAWGAGPYAEEFSKHSPSKYATLPQIRLEPILKQRAQELNSEALKYRAEVTDVREQEGDDYAVLKVRFNGQEPEQDVRARFVICADGGRSFTDKLGVRWLGESDIHNMVTAHFRSPLSKYHPDPRNFITWFTRPDLGGGVRTGFLYQIGPWPAQPETEEWVLVCMPGAMNPERIDSEAMANRVRETLQLPDLPIDMLSLSPWNVNAIYAERYRPTKRVFLAGDAAHRIPPWGALGMNTGVQDVTNLIWKLALALQDEAKYDALLDIYDTERKPIGERVGRTSLYNLRSHSLVMDAALGMSADNSPEQNWAALKPYFDPTHPGTQTLDSEFKAPGAEVGWFYPSADFDGEGARSRHDGQLTEAGELATEFYYPSTIPGHNVPHAWLQNHGVAQGRRVAVFDLIPLRQMLLLARQRDVGWEQLEGDLVHVEVVGEGGDWVDADGEWARQCGVSERGAVVVRPDGIVAWRGRTTYRKLSEFSLSES
ncbi:FAD binding domain-containing protein [Fomitopsis serialis]|uniref:FAD binding domain-containing protein n=1 Tax=Fomitopsis serialis TaxID=139415 RepID=UPI002008E937|nr:FAD binding domain-containing protein [Neoantrodia serialis]KAH9936107.1 FAD binding domain-containing protein [Neoantrodia serialis]